MIPQGTLSKQLQSAKRFDIYYPSPTHGDILVESLAGHDLINMRKIQQYHPQMRTGDATTGSVQPPRSAKRINFVPLVPFMDFQPESSPAHANIYCAASSEV